jgi:hypothetical protein
MSISQINSTTIRQMKAQGINARRWIVDGDFTVRAHDAVRVGTNRSRSTYMNVDVTYDRGRDLYDVEVHTISRVDFSVVTRESTGVYSDGIATCIEVAERS